MSNEYKLNPKQTALEAQLANFSLPNSSLNRDEFLYQAGWNAAMSEVQADGVAVEKSKSVWVWKATSLLATSAAMVLFALLVFDDDRLSGVAVERNQVDQTETSIPENGPSTSGLAQNSGESTEVSPVAEPGREELQGYSVVNFEYTPRLSSGALLQGRRSQLRPTTPIRFNPSSIAPSTSKTRFELRNELLSNAG